MQGILAPVQFAVFLMSLGFIIHFMVTGRGETAATVSVVVKTVTLYTIMITGAIWERQVFGRSVMLFDTVDRGQLSALGETRTPGIADLFVAVIGGENAATAQGAAA